MYDSLSVVSISVALFWACVLFSFLDCYNACIVPS